MSSQKPTTLREAFRQHLIVTQKKPRTVEAYIDALVQFYRFTNGKHPLHVTVNDIRAFLFHITHERGYAPRTYNQIYYGLRAFYEVFMPEVPIMAPFCRHRVRDGNITVISRFDFDRMLALTRNPKHKAVLALLYSSGIRSSECAAIGVDDFDKEQMLIRVMGKGEKLRYTVFSPRCRALLREYVKVERPTTRLFPGRTREHISTEMIGHIVREAAKRAGLSQRVYPHILRHSFATHFLETDGRLPVLQSMLGHAQPKTTYRYTHVDAALIRTVKSPLDTPAEQFGPRCRRNKGRAS